MKKLFFLSTVFLLFNCNGNAQKEKQQDFKVTKTEKQWQSELNDMEYKVLRQAYTEPPHSSPLDKNFKKGTYICKACNAPLFKSENKFDAHCGWPSFDQEIKGNITYQKDYKLGYPRIEEICASCGSHLGHVFDDGPMETTGKRHCINGVALKFIPDEN
ncbi:peptide-methionine (R)-S-oxide reductase MsrB [Gaetbulibacter saemankumensis]|uniref:peptide-methionine (R)-S-oxide reductase MsrB n=1 Tax=Gaetbulibacter saemankumensis TaxID=311208 RepID=UPI0003FA53C1|nr:peptide-methionine (R)-S-oxide reductase MsrB [Gaetbulibacter saemankumensis]